MKTLSKTMISVASIAAMLAMTSAVQADSSKIFRASKAIPARTNEAIITPKPTLNSSADQADSSRTYEASEASPATTNETIPPPKPTFNFCFDMPSITTPTNHVLLNQSTVGMSVDGCNGKVDLKLHLVKNSSLGNPTLATYAITSLPWSQDKYLRDGAYTLFLQNGSNTKQYDAFHFEVAKLN